MDRPLSKTGEPIERRGNPDYSGCLHHENVEKTCNEVPELWKTVNKKVSISTLLTIAGLLAVFFVALYGSHSETIRELKLTDKETNARIDAQILIISISMEKIQKSLEKIDASMGRGR